MAAKRRRWKSWTLFRVNYATGRNNGVESTYKVEDYHYMDYSALKVVDNFP